MHRLLLITLVLATSPVRSQTDSLWRVWNDRARPDSARLKAIQVLAWKAVFERPDSGIALAHRQLEMAVASGDARSRYDAYTTMAVGSSMKSDYAAALDNLQQGLRTARALSDRRREANAYSNMSNVYRNLGDLPLALEHLQLSQQIDTELDNKEGLAGTLNNIGNIHTELGDLPNALAHYQHSAALYAELNNTKGRAQALLNIGATHLEMGDRTNALEEFLESLALYRIMGRRLETGMAFNNLGRAYGKLGRDMEARTCLDSARTIFTELGSKRQLVRNLFYTGELALEQGEPRKAITACTAGLEIARDNGLAQQRKECSTCLMNAYEAVGDLANAFRAQKEAVQVGDSLDKLNNSREVTRLNLQRQFQERQIADSLANVRQRYEDELEHQVALAGEREQRNLFLYGGLGVMLLAGGLWSRLRYTRRSRAIIQRERNRSDELLHNILPEEVAAELKEKGYADVREFAQATILFTDFKGFTTVSERLSPAELVAELNVCFKAFDGLMEKYRIEKIKTIGDAYMAAGGLPDPHHGPPADVVRAALEMQAFITQRKAANEAQGKPAFEMRAGIHTGPVVAGIVGVKKFQYDIWGDTVNTASRMESSGEVGQVNISEATYALVKDEPGLTFTPRGKVQAKGKGELEMYFVARR